MKVSLTFVFCFSAILFCSSACLLLLESIDRLITSGKDFVPSSPELSSSKASFTCSFILLTEMEKVKIIPALKISSGSDDPQQQPQKLCFPRKERIKIGQIGIFSPLPCLLQGYRLCLPWLSAPSLTIDEEGTIIQSKEQLSADSAKNYISYFQPPLLENAVAPHPPALCHPEKVRVKTKVCTG